MTPDFNLLITLDAPCWKRAVAGAARQLGLSASAMSRALARLRETTGSFAGAGGTRPDPPPPGADPAG